MFPIEKVRADCPACQNKLFFNSAGASLVPTIVQKSIREYLEKEAEIGGYALADLMSADIQEFYSSSAKLLNTQARNIAFAYNATDAYSRALSAIPFQAGAVVLISEADYVSNYLSLFSLRQRFGIEIKRFKSLENGDLDLEDLEKSLQKYRPILLAITHIPTSSGLVQDVEKAGEICAKYDTYYLVDACQSLGQIPVDVEKMVCDFLSATGRKFLRGPRGTALLYVSDRVLRSQLSPMFLDLQSAEWTDPDSFQLMDDARRFELWEKPMALLLGLKEAIQYLNNLGIENVYRYNQEILHYARKEWGAIPGIEIYDRGSALSSIITLRKEGVSKEKLSAHLQKNSVYFSLAQKASAQIDFAHKNIEWALRISPHYFNTQAEIDRLSQIFADLH